MWIRIILLSQGRLVGRISSVGSCVRVGGNCLKSLKRGWNRNEGRGNKYFKKRGQAGSRGGCLKKGTGLELPYEPSIRSFQAETSNQQFHTIQITSFLIYLKYIFSCRILWGGDRAANKYYFSVGHHEQKHEKGTCQIKFSMVTIKQKMKLVLQHSLYK